KYDIDTLVKAQMVKTHTKIAIRQSCIPSYHCSYRLIFPKTVIRGFFYPVCLDRLLMAGFCGVPTLARCLCMLSSPILYIFVSKIVKASLKAQPQKVNSTNRRGV
ncbi:MAG: hypothetical protein QXO71_02795, partial [Candidatus Jordarchaeaceae archaeon]